jgi:hypothetical protein
MGVVLLVTLLVAILFIAAFVGGFRASTGRVQRQKQTLVDVESLKQELRLPFALLDPAGRLLGIRSAERTLVIRNGREAELRELRYEHLLEVSLTATTSSQTETTGESTTPRTTQILSAGLGAAVAGPAGAVVGGLTAPQRHASTSRTSDNMDELQLELRLLDDALPRFTLQTGGPIVAYEVEQAFRDMGARLANIVDTNRIH